MEAHVRTVLEIYQSSRDKKREYVLDDRRLARLNDESSTGNIDLLLHGLQFIRAGFKQDVCH